MTTYLATIWNISTYGPVEELTLPYCSWGCREIARVNEGQFVVDCVTLDRYEFDETCARCGRAIPASDHE